MLYNYLLHTTSADCISRYVFVSSLPVNILSYMHTFETKRNSPNLKEQTMNFVIINKM